MSKKRNDMDALVAKLMRPRSTAQDPQGITPQDPTPAQRITAHRDTSMPEKKHYKPKPESDPRKTISNEMVEELNLTPEMVRAINKIRERDRTARERDTRSGTTYGLKEGYKRHTFALNVEQLETLKEIAKDQKVSLYHLIENIFTDYIKRYDNDKR